MKVILLLVLLVSIVILLFIRNKNCYKEEDFPKIIWILWLQGWDNAPWLQQRVKESWEKHNPGWEVKCIDENNCPVKIDGDTPPAKSDVIRMRILDDIGGVWADSTLLCMEPLDNWYKNAIEPTGFWMYRGRTGGFDSGNPEMNGPASWFILSRPKNVIISKWRKATDEYQNDNSIDYGYFWLDKVFTKCCEDKLFKDEWEKVPYHSCEDYGSSHMLAGKVLGNDIELHNIMKTNPPHVIKMDKACSENPSLENNCTFAIYLKTNL